MFTADDKKELNDTKKRYNELSEKLMEKNRQYLKLQVNYFVYSSVSHSLKNCWFSNVSVVIGRLDVLSGAMLMTSQYKLC